MQKAVLTWFLVVACGLVMAPYAWAADLNAIKSQVEQRVEERQQQVEQAPTQQVSSDASHPGDTAKPTLLENKLHWSVLNGAIKLQTIQGQLYLSLFS
jgi:hypothetical protein